MAKPKSASPESRSSAGLPSSRISLEVLYMLPETFVLAYRRMFDQALREDTTRARLSDTPGARGYKGHWVIQDERALARKGRVDKKLRNIAREILAETKKSKDHMCSRCRKFVEHEWTFCPWCGSVERREL